MREESRQISRPLGHILLFVVLVALVRLCGRHNHIWIRLNEIVLEQVKVFILSAHFTPDNRDLHLERAVVLLVEEAARALHQSLAYHNLDDRSFDSRQPGRHQLLRRDRRFEVYLHSTLMAGISLWSFHRL